MDPRSIRNGISMCSNYVERNKVPCNSLLRVELCKLAMQEAVARAFHPCAAQPKSSSKPSRSTRWA
jgi:hypothetical protein